MNYKTANDKIIVSFGEKCAFDCKYCYTFTQDFCNYTKRNSQEIIEAIRNFPNQDFETICVSGDMESFTDEKRAVDLIEKLATLEKDIIFTTKIKLSDLTIKNIAKINQILHQKNKMIIAYVTISSMESAKKLEPFPIATPQERIETIKNLNKAGIKVILAMRPFLPSVKLDEYKQILDATSDYIEAVCGGVLFFDKEGIVEKRLGYKITDFKLSPMYFVEGTPTVKTYEGKREQQFVKNYCKKIGKEFFMQSHFSTNFVKQKYLKSK